MRMIFALLGLLLMGSLSATDSATAYSATLLDRVKDAVEYSKSYSSQQEDINTLLEELKTNQTYAERGSDDFRVKFVGTQAAVEHVIACAQAMGEIDQLIGVIHTPMPATPLCMRPEEDPSTGLLDDSIATDMDKLLTVRSRAQILREYLEKGGKLYVVYPRGGLEKRTAEQQAIYKETLKAYPQALVDCPIDVDAIQDDCIGATYLFRDKSGILYAFSIKSTQANDPKQNVEWAMWFGPIAGPEVSARVSSLFDYLQGLKGPDVRAEFNLDSHR